MMDPIKTEDRRVVNIHKAKFEPIETDGTPDGEVLHLNDARPLGAGFYVYRDAARAHHGGPFPQGRTRNFLIPRKANLTR